MIDDPVLSMSNSAGLVMKATYNPENDINTYVKPGHPEEDKHRMYYTDSRLLNCTKTPMGVTTRYIYNAQGQVTSTQQGNDPGGGIGGGVIITPPVIIGGDGTIITGSEPQIRTETYYTTDGNHVAGQKDARGKTVTYDVNLSKDLTNSVTGPNGQTVNYTYDDLKRVSEVRTMTSGNAYINGYAYDKDRLKSVKHNTTTDSLDVSYTFEYDEPGNPTKTRVGAQVLSENTYSATGDKLLEKVTYGNGGQVKYTYDGFKRLTGIRYDTAADPQVTYHYGKNGDLRKVKDVRLGTTTQTTLDQSDRPVRVETIANAVPGQAQAVVYAKQLVYDGCRHVYQQTETVPDGSNYTTTYGYDRDDRPTTITYATNDTVVCTLDSMERLTKREQQIGGAKNTVAYTYVNGGYGEVSRTGLVATMTQTGENWSYTYDDAGSIQAAENGNVNKYTYDPLGQLTRMDDQTASKSYTYTYDAWGKPTGCAGPLANTLGKDNPFRYRGYVYDEETGLYYLRSRYYNPEWGRFVNADLCLGVASQMLSHNPYTYCFNRAVCMCEPDGRTAVAAAAGLADALLKLLAAALAAITAIALPQPKVDPKPKLQVIQGGAQKPEPTPNPEPGPGPVTVTQVENTARPEKRDVTIYRWAWKHDFKSVTPRPKDRIKEDGGPGALSFSQYPGGGSYYATTKNTLENTDLFTVNVDGVDGHVSVRPSDMTRWNEWVDTFTNSNSNPHFLTLTLYEIMPYVER